MIEVQSLSKSYGPILAVDDVSFKVNRGEVVAFVGPNGAGKSTVLKILSTYLKPDSGTALIKDVDVVRNPLRVRMSVGYQPENSIAYEGMRVDDFLRFVGKSRWLDRARLKEQVEWVVEEIGLESVLHKRVGQCSKGYRRRVSIAMALIHDPDVLLLDEPTHGLDPLQVFNLREFIRSLRPGKAILFSSHIFQEVVAICDRVLIINEGRILADGTVTKLALDTGRKPVISCEFEAPAGDLRKAVEGIGKCEVRHFSEGDGGTVAAEIVASDDGVGQRLSEICEQNGWTLKSSQLMPLNLEEIFADIIRGSAGEVVGT